MLSFDFKPRGCSEKTHLPEIIGTIKSICLGILMCSREILHRKPSKKSAMKQEIDFHPTKWKHIKHLHALQSSSFILPDLTHLVLISHENHDKCFHR